MSGLVRVELGSGYAPTPGFLHVDINPNATSVDLVAPAYPLPFENESVDELRAVDVLEHISYRDTRAVLVEWARVLRPGGMLYVQVPDAGEIMSWFSFHPARLLERIPDELPQTPISGVAWRLLGGHMDGQSVRDGDDFRWNAHYALFTRVSLEHGLRSAGFVVKKCETNGHPNLMCWATRK